MRDKANKANRIEQILKLPGWKEIEAIIYAKFENSMDALREKENPEARGAVNAIIEIMDDISSEIQFGKVAKEKYKERCLKNQTPIEG